MLFSIHKTLFLICLSIASSFVYADMIQHEKNNTKTDKTIRKLYHSLNAKPTPMPERLNQVSRSFLNKPYENNALGEGASAQYDQEALYRTDAFDCETYVDTVLAIALAIDLNTFKQCIKHIRYQNSQPSFITRNHFTSIDWNFYNQKKGILKDITKTLVDTNQQPVAIISETFINKPNWYKNLSSTRIRLPNTPETKKTQRLNTLRQQGQTLNAETAYTPYIPLTALFNKKGEPNHMLFNQIPNGAVIEIIRPNWNLEEQIGTRLDISHLGFVFREKGQLRFRHASDTLHQVSDVSLLEYLKKACQSPTIRGINIQVVQPQTPHAHHCTTPSNMSLLQRFYHRVIDKIQY